MAGNELDSSTGLAGQVWGSLLTVGGASQCPPCGLSTYLTGHIPSTAFITWQWASLEKRRMSAFIKARLRTGMSDLCCILLIKANQRAEAPA